MEPTIQSYNMVELLDKFGLEPTPWTGHHPEKFTFYVEGCDEPIVPRAPVQGNGIGNPALDKYWPPTLLSEREEMGECSGSCGTYVKAWQTLQDKLYDNGEYDAICPPPTYHDYDNGFDQLPPDIQCLIVAQLPTLASGKPGATGEVFLVDECTDISSLPQLP